MIFLKEKKIFHQDQFEFNVEPTVVSYPGFPSYWRIYINPVGFFAKNGYKFDGEISACCLPPKVSPAAETSLDADPVDYPTFNDIRQAFLNFGYVENVNLPFD